ncbi:MAG: NAD(P)/FAD-dependent oxidoreductase [Clostridiales bacterium]|nr:NAD(P)/FAD-dependent oxidoreductase [Clostridiales bacterium]
MENKHYDVAIVGAGIAGIMAAYELVTKSDLSVVLFEQGNSIYKRVCPIVDGKVNSCINCNACSIMKGFGGAGNFSDGKYNLTTAFGGWLTDYISDKEVMELINYVDEINVKFGATTETYSTRTPEALAIEKRALEHDLHLLHATVKHLGTENNLNILKGIYEFLKDKVEIKCNMGITDIAVKDEGYEVTTVNNEAYSSKYLIAAPGRAGAEWFSNQCKKLDIPLINNQVDIGVRVELPARVFEHVTDAVYESKLTYRTNCHGDRVRTFCMNPYGHVVMENVDGLVTVNGHSYSDPALRSENTNFSLLVSSRFTKPFNDPYQYGKRIASLSNLLGGGVIVQRFGDLVKGNRTNEHRLSQSTVIPTLNATPGDLSLVIPKRQLDDIIEMIYALDKLAPGTANYDTLLYGVEVKFYSAKPELNNELETKYKNFFAIGDGAGVTRGLAQAAATGVYVARNILKR